MNVCPARAISNPTHFPSRGGGLLLPTQQHRIQWSPTSIFLPNRGKQSYKYSLLRSTLSDETSSGTSQYLKDEAVITFQERKSSEEKEYGQTMSNEATEQLPIGEITMEDRSPSEESYDETEQDEAPQEDSPLDVQKKLSEFLDQLNIKFDSEDTYSIFLFGGSAAATLYLATAIVGAIDSIPVFPKLMEVVGLGYSIWFTSRFLLYKSNRDELAAKVEELKHQILGSKDE